MEVPKELKDTKSSRLKIPISADKTYLMRQAKAKLYKLSIVLR